MKRILVIEDNTEVRENLEETLELYGYQVATAEDGKIGVEKAIAHPPDLIICDVMMPRLDGFGVLNILSRKPATANIPFIFLTAKSEREDIRRGMSLGADDYITKPFYKDELLQVIETRLKKRERLQAAFDKTANGWQAFVNEARGYEALKQLSTESPSRSYRKKDILFSEGQQVRHLLLLTRGKIKLYKTSEYGKELIISVLEPGSFIGYSDIIKDEPYQCSAAALDDEVEVQMIAKTDFQQLLYSNQDVASCLIKMLAQNVSSKEEQLLQMAYHSVRKRVAEVLMQLYDQQPEGEQKINMLREDLAGMVGTAKESLIRMLSEFRNDGYLQIEHGEITVLAPGKLRKLPA